MRIFNFYRALDYSYFYVCKKAVSFSQPVAVKDFIYGKTQHKKKNTFNEFSLTIHPTGQFGKKIKDKLYY